MVLDRSIDVALNHSPRHRSAMLSTISLTDGSISEIARVIGIFCRQNGVQDFPNPFVRDRAVEVMKRTVWDVNFGLQPLQQQIEERKAQGRKEQMERNMVEAEAHRHMSAEIMTDE